MVQCEINVTINALRSNNIYIQYCYVLFQRVKPVKYLLQKYTSVMEKYAKRSSGGK